MRLTSYAKALVQTKEEKEKNLSGTRAGEMKQKALHEISKLDVTITEKQTFLTELAARYPLDFNAIIQAQDDLALAERRKRQLSDIVGQLFPGK